MAGSLQRYYVPDGCGGGNWRCSRRLRPAATAGGGRQHAATPGGVGDPDLVCADCGAGCGCPGPRHAGG